MIENKILSGLVTSVPLAMILALNVLLRGEELTIMLTDNSTFGSISNEQATIIMIVGMVAGSLLLGIIAGLVYGLIGSRQLFPFVALGLALILSLFAVVTRTPQLADKIMVNFAVALVLGCLIPLLAA